MAQYIDKNALVAEVERQYNYLREHPGTYGSGFILGFRQAGWQISDFIDTLEVKDVDLEKSARHYLLHEHLSPLNNILHQADLKTEMQYHKDIETAFKAGFELGVKVQKGE